MGALTGQSQKENWQSGQENVHPSAKNIISANHAQADQAQLESGAQANQIVVSERQPSSIHGLQSVLSAKFRIDSAFLLC